MNGLDQPGALLTLAAVVLAALATIIIGALGIRLSRTTSDFLVASRTVGPSTNAAAISGEYLSAASFLGVAGLIAKHGADALWYPVGFTAGYLFLLMFIAAPLRRSGAYTVPDFAEYRLASPALRYLAMIFVVIIVGLYMVPQFHGAGLTLNILLGFPDWVGVAAVGGIVIANVVAGGMRSITFVQAFQYWLKLTAIAIPAIAVAVFFLNDPRPIGDAAPPTAPSDLAVSVETTFSVDVATPTTIEVFGRVGDAHVSGPVELTPGTHVIGAGSTVLLPEGSPIPTLTGIPATGDLWLQPGEGRLSTPDDNPGIRLYITYSIIIAIFLGTLGLPHVLVRFYTNKTGSLARWTSLIVIAMLAVFYLFPVILGVLSRIYVPQLLMTGTSDAVVLLMPTAVFVGVGGQILAALVAAGAIAAFMSTSSGLLVCAAGVLSTDVMGGRVRDFRVSALLAGSVVMALAFGATRLDLSQSVGLVFAVAASTFAPLLLLGIWWRGLTAAGAYAGLLVGGVASMGAVVLTASGMGPSAGWAGALVTQPAAWSVPLTFGVMVLVSRATRRDTAAVGGLFARMHVPERFGMVRDRDAERWG
ncbi:cation acetate symporter [Hoyosella rhizosphaerae]|uniref:Cation acetate symporter n=1 Tax=Hoyosella rhizosphaerae TaxID=1755582 RepID=A0A916XHP7_9ACTN|nr:cation acetate symporter [Hoyosella rhizosphaerae]MBN4928164.1 cation acetate symporter [Hoyosella rhizosphaerae]GGC72902.1 cation acetate symporter [Hoyosella rhizosphaerae]